jgi:hypothetical protein
LRRRMQRHLHVRCDAISSGYYGAVDVKTLTGLGATPIAIEEMLREVVAFLNLVTP